ncbi:unnamed protein product, partial [Rotaria sp. Silwood2]
KQSLEKAYEHLLERRSIAAPNYGFLIELIRYENESSGYVFSHLYQSSYQSMSSMNDDDGDKIENDNLSLIRMEHNYSKSCAENVNQRKSIGTSVS